MLLLSYFPAWDFSPKTTAFGGIPWRKSSFSALEAPVFMEGVGFSFSVFSPYTSSGYYVGAASLVYKFAGLSAVYESISDSSDYYSELRAVLSLRSPWRVVKGFDFALKFSYLREMFSVDSSSGAKGGLGLGISASYRASTPRADVGVFFVSENVLSTGLGYELPRNSYVGLVVSGSSWGVGLKTAISSKVVEGGYVFSYGLGAYKDVGPLSLIVGLNDGAPALGLSVGSRLGSVGLSLDYSLLFSLSLTHKIALEVEL